MATTWYDRDETNPQQPAGNWDSFRQHDERMRDFRLAHPELVTPIPGAAAAEDCFTLLPLRRLNFSRFILN